MLGRENLIADVRKSSTSGIPFENESMDAVVSMSVLEHIRDLAPFVAEIDRVLKPGGCAIIGVPVDNPVTKVLLRTGYLLLPNAKLEDEHVTRHADILAAFRRRFDVGPVLHIPRLLPEILRMYTTTLFLKRAEGGSRPGRRN